MSKERDRNSPRAAPNDDIDRVLDLFADLKARLDQNGPNGAPGTGMLEKYDYFCRVSDRGRACSYSMKSKKLFLLNDFKDVKDIVEKLVRHIRKLPGNENFGR